MALSSKPPEFGGHRKYLLCCLALFPSNPPPNLVRLMVPRYAGVTMATEQPCKPNNQGAELAKTRQFRERRLDPLCKSNSLRI